MHPMRTMACKSRNTHSCRMKESMTRAYKKGSRLKAENAAINDFLRDSSTFEVACCMNSSTTSPLSSLSECNRVQSKSPSAALMAPLYSRSRSLAEIRQQNYSCTMYFNKNV